MLKNEHRYRYPAFTMSSPAIYRIRVRGKLDEKIAERLAGMNLTEEATSGDIPDSILVGRILDQAALNGVLHTLYELHLPLISIDCLDFEPERQRRG